LVPKLNERIGPSSLLCSADVRQIAFVRSKGERREDIVVPDSSNAQSSSLSGFHGRCRDAISCNHIFCNHIVSADRPRNEAQLRDGRNVKNAPKFMYAHLSKLDWFKPEFDKRGCSDGQVMSKRIDTLGDISFPLIMSAPSQLES
jgi:hypothetical protein